MRSGVVIFVRGDGRERLTGAVIVPCLRELRFVHPFNFIQILFVRPDMAAYCVSGKTSLTE